VLGSSIALYDPPIRVAEEFAMLDVISGGRLVAGFPVDTPIRNRTANAKRGRFYARGSGKRPQQIVLRSHDTNLAVRHLDALGKRAEVIATVAAARDPYPLAGCRSELPHHGRRDGLLPGASEGRRRSLRIGLRLIAD
jgi:hypothetical protein